MIKQSIFTLLPLITLLTTLVVNKGSKKDLFFQLSMLTAVIIEAMALSYAIITRTRPSIIYNFYIPLTFAINCIMLTGISNLKTTFEKRWKFIGLFIVTFIIECFTIDLFKEYIKVSYLLACILLLYLAFSYLLEIMNSDQIINILQLRYVWVSMGLLLFYVPFIPLFFSVNYLASFGDIYYYVILALNIIMHLCFNFGFIWTRKIK